ncbi:MAG: glycoside hydrolase family 9 protein, partial [Planctomycetota bacterium]
MPVRFILLAVLSAAVLASEHNYAEALQKALYFYEHQEAGPLSPGNRVEWRGDSTLRDGTDVGRDLTGGWYDAGDTVKWTNNAAYGATMLAWALARYPDAFRAVHQHRRGLANLRHGTDFLLRCVDADSPTGFRIYVGVGTGGSLADDPVSPADHNALTSLNEWKDVPHTIRKVDGVPQPGSIRPSYWVDEATGGPDVAGHMCAALASASIAFRESGDVSYADQLLSVARAVDAFGEAHPAASTVTRRLRDGGIVDLATYHTRNDKPFGPRLWGAAWLQRAELAAGNQSAADAALQAARDLYQATPSGDRGNSWTGHSVGRPEMGAYCLLAAQSGDAAFIEQVNKYCDFWLYRRRSQTGLSTDITTTSGGFVCRGDGAHWNMNQLMNVLPGFLVWADSEHNTDARQKSDLLGLATGTYTVDGDTYPVCPVRQIDYMLGDNPLGVSYLVGYGESWPENLLYSQTRGLIGGNGTAAANKPLWNTFTMYGTLVPGPDHNDQYPLDQTLHEAFTIAYQEPVIYSGGHISVLARMIEDLGDAAGSPLAVFPEWIVPDEDERRSRYYVQAYARSDVAPSNGMRIVAELHSHSFIEPQERNQLGFRIYLGIDSGGADALDITNVWGSDKIQWSGPHEVDQDTVSFDIRFVDDYIGPGDYNNFRRRVEFVVKATSGSWDASNDHSLAGMPFEDGLVATSSIIDAMPVYDFSGSAPVLLGGLEPSAGYVRWRRALFNNSWEQAGNITLIAERIGGEQGAVSATVAFTDQTARLDKDYQMPESTLLSWTAGERGPKTLHVALIEDDLREGLESFQ